MIVYGPIIRQEMTCSNNSPDEEDSEALSRTEKEASNSDPCDQGTSFELDVATNAVIHNGEQSYSRYLSEHSSKIKSTSRHHKTTRPRKRIYACEHCDYAAKRKGTLAGHMRIHTGEFPFACITCDYKTWLKSRQHMLTHS